MMCNQISGKPLITKEYGNHIFIVWGVDAINLKCNSVSH